MYVRWVVRKHKNAKTADVTFHDAYLVESYRDDRNTPRQRLVCYLGNVRQIDGEFRPVERELFLMRADRILASELDVPFEERNHIMSLLHQKVPGLTAEEVEAAFHHHLRWYYHWRHQRGDPPTREELIRLVSAATQSFSVI